MKLHLMCSHIKKKISIVRLKCFLFCLFIFIFRYTLKLFIETYDSKGKKRQFFFNILNFITSTNECIQQFLLSYP